LTVVERPGYRLELDPDRWSMAVEPASGPPLELSLLFAVDKVGERDETLGLGSVRVEGDEVVVPRRSTAWASAELRIRCDADADAVVLTGVVTGSGAVGEVSLLGGRGVLASGAAGLFPSAVTFREVFTPAPTEPVQPVRDAFVPASIGVVGDARAGRWHGLFSPAPLCFAVSAGGPWHAIGLTAPVEELRFPELRYDPLDGGFRLVADYEGHTGVDGTFATPPVELRFGANDPYDALADHTRGLRPERELLVADWWREPILCGWGAQCLLARQDGGSPASYATQRVYDEFLDTLARHDIVPGTVVVDDRWQREYGTGEPDEKAWPDLRGWIDRRHADGQKVLLWWKAWDPEGVPADLCVRTADGRQVALDAGVPAAADFLASRIHVLLSPEGLDADGLKIDFTQRAPSGASLRPTGDTWGIALLHRMLDTIYRAAKRAKPDALIVTHTPHPAFADVTDMIRLNDLAIREPSGKPVAPADQMRFRAGVVRAALPDHPIDTDDWPMPDRAEWRRYAAEKTELGVPALYYVDGIDESGEAFDASDYELIRTTWRSYRDGGRQ
jgi:hypothetical protein